MKTGQNFSLISRPNVDEFKLSIHNLKAISKPVKIRYCKLKFMHVWLHGSLGKVGHMVHGCDMTETRVLLQ